MSEPKVTFPTRHLYENAPYKRAAETNIAATFKRVRAQLKKQAEAASNVAPLKKRAIK